jgi:hypothetical protein
MRLCDPRVAVGERILHPRFGLGTVVRTSEYKNASVRFDNPVNPHGYPDPYHISWMPIGKLKKLGISYHPYLI